MNENSKIIEFNLSPSPYENAGNQIIDNILHNQNQYPELNLLLSDVSGFCQNKFSKLIKRIVREKRQLDFETPNRIKITHEYTINQDNLNSNFYYLFTPSGRLDWLKIFIEDERVSIADKSIVKKAIYKSVKNEYKLLKNSFPNMDKASFIDTIYENLNGLPCFIEYNNLEKISNQLSCLIIVEYRTSIQKVKQKNNLVQGLFNPIVKKHIKYNYTPLSSRANSWLYLKAPRSFELNCITQTTSDIDSAQTNDPEICSYVIKSNGQMLNYDFDIFIKAPKSLSVWFLSLYYSTILAILIITLSLIDKYNIFSKSELLHPLCFIHDSIKSIDEGILVNLGFALIAGIIATRGWLIVEENILKKISIRYTVLMVVLFILIGILSIW